MRLVGNFGIKARTLMEDTYILLKMGMILMSKYVFQMKGFMNLLFMILMEMDYVAHHILLAHMN